MTIHMICPAPPRSRLGNRITAVRWSRILRDLGHRVRIMQRYDGNRCDVLIALHARRSADSIARFSHRYPGRPLVVALTGTDLYRDIRMDTGARRSIELATRIVVLQPAAIREIPHHLRAKIRTIFQSTRVIRGPVKRSKNRFEIAIVGHLRAEKDPFRTEAAVRGLPNSSRIRVLHAGAALTSEYAAVARRLSRRNPRYRWLGEMSRGRARALIASARLMVLTSIMEGGANVISEAVMSGTPIIASRIASSEGLLGNHYPGFFPVGDTRALRVLLVRAEQEPDFLRLLGAYGHQLRPLFRPERERRTWKGITAEIE